MAHKHISSKIKTEDGETLSVQIAKNGFVSISVLEIGEDTTLGSITVTGLSAAKAAKKSKSFWGKLWSKIKSFVGSLMKSPTFPIGPLNCRPHAGVGYQNDRITSFEIGIQCTL